MKRINIGVADLVVSNLLKESYFNKTPLLESKNVPSDLLNLVKGSPILQLELKTLTNVENKHILNEALAIKYIEESIKPFGIYTLEELQVEHKKLEPMIGDHEIVDDRVNLYEAITVLIEESLKIGADIDVDQIHEAFETVLTHITKPPKEVPKVPEHINEQVIEIAINKFNEKYENLSEDEVNLFKTITTSTHEEKVKLFKEFKEENVQILEELQKDNSNDKIIKSIEKINEMKSDPQEVDGNIVKLFELKSGLQ